MGSQPNLAKRSEVVLIYKCPQNVWSFPQIWGAKKHEILTTFSLFPHSTPHISGTERRINKQKRQCQSTMCLLKTYLLSVTFDPETAEIRLLIVSDPHFGGHYVTTTIVATYLVEN